VEQLLLYVVTFVGFFGFVFGVLSFVVPYVQERGVSLPFALPFLQRDSVEDDDLADDDYDEDAFDAFTDAGFSETLTTTLRPPPASIERAPLATEAAGPAPSVAGAAGDAQAALWPAEPATVTDAAGSPMAESPEPGEEAATPTDGEGEGEPSSAGPPVLVHTAMAAAADIGDDMLALFQEAAEGVKQVRPWREDLGDTDLEEVLRQARELRQLLSGTKSRRPNAA